MVARSLIARGIGIGMLSRLALQAFHNPGVTVREIPRLRPRTLHLVHHREANRIPAVRAAVRALRDAIAN